MRHIGNKLSHIAFDRRPSLGRQGMRFVSEMVMPMAANRCDQWYKQNQAPQSHEFHLQPFFRSLHLRTRRRFR
jgi:hypothetical protein